MKVKTLNIQRSMLKDSQARLGYFEEGPSRRFDLEDRLLEFGVEC